MDRIDNTSKLKWKKKSIYSLLHWVTYKWRGLPHAHVSNAVITINTSTCRQGVSSLYRSTSTIKTWTCVDTGMSAVQSEWPTYSGLPESKETRAAFSVGRGLCGTSGIRSSLSFSGLTFGTLRGLGVVRRWLVPGVCMHGWLDTALTTSLLVLLHLLRFGQ